MKAFRTVLAVVAVFAAAGLCSAQTPGTTDANLQPQAPPTPQTLVIDVATDADGRLVGQVVDRQGTPLQRAAVSVRDRDRELRSTRTDGNGLFVVDGLGAGVYQLVGAEGRGFYRVWAPGTAPPGARATVLLVAGQDVVRGQPNLFGLGGLGGMNLGGLGGLGGLGQVFANPWFAAAAVGASVSAPVTVHNAERSRLESPPTSP